MITGSIQPKNGKYYAVLNLYDHTGKRRPKWISTGYTVKGNKKKAQEVLNELTRRYSAQLPPSKRGQPACTRTVDMTLLDFLYEWLSTRKPHIQPTTYHNYTKMIEGRVTDCFGPQKMLLMELNYHQLDDFYNSIRKDGCCENSVVKYHAMLKMALDYAIRKEYIQINAADRAVEKPSRKNRYKPNYYSRDELNRLLRTVTDDVLYVPILLAAYYGLRRSEVLGIRWSSIDFEKKTIAIEHKVIEGSAAGQEGLLLMDEMKTKSSRRTLPLLPTPERALLDAKARQEEYRRACRKGYCTKYLEYACVDSLGNLLSPAFLSAHFSYLLEKHGLPHIRFHDLRHTCASLLVAEGVDMKRIQLWLGHSNFSTTADIYAHLDFASKRDTGAVIDSLLGELPGEERIVEERKYCMQDEGPGVRILEGEKT